jgi:uncharacterized protein (DUF58 family)
MALRLKPDQRLALTREGRHYALLWVGLVVLGLYLQSNLILLIAGLAAGPLVASVLLSSRILRGLQVERRSPAYVFAGEPLALDYTLGNNRRWTPALATFIEDELVPLERSVPGATAVSPRLGFARVPRGERSRLRWETVAPARGRYRFEPLEILTRAPFGLVERRQALDQPGELIVYPRVGTLAAGVQPPSREATRTRRGNRQDRSAQQQEYHGLRDYRPGDSLRWIHWRTSARLGQPMVLEFEQRQEQDLAILLDPWLPRSKVTPELRETLEAAIRLAATLCLEACKQPGRRLLFGWTGPVPGLLQGFASVKLLHELLTQLAVMRPSAEGRVAGLLEVLPPTVLRDGQLVIVSTRAVNLLEEAERSRRLPAGSGRGLLGRVRLFDAGRVDLAELVQFDGAGDGRRPGRLADAV